MYGDAKFEGHSHFRVDTQNQPIIIDHGLTRNTMGDGLGNQLTQQSTLH